MSRAICQECGADMFYAKGEPTEKKPEGANIPLVKAPVYWPANTTDHSLSPAQAEAASSKPTPAYDLVDGRAVKIGSFYIVKNPKLFDKNDISVRWISHFANCTNPQRFSRR